MIVELVNLADGFSCYTTSEYEARFIYKEIFDDHCYDGPKLPETPFIIDAGANIGLFTLYIKQKYPSSEILAFEPVPETFDILSRNLSLHDISGVETYLYGLGSKSSTEKLTYFPNMPGNSTLRPEEKEVLRKAAAERFGQEVTDQQFGGAKEVNVKLQRLSHFLHGHPSISRIDLLKIDVEGAELEVLRGLDDVHWDMIQNLMVETCETSGIRAGIEELLQSKGFTVTREEASWAPNEFYMITACRDNDSVS